MLWGKSWHGWDVEIGSVMSAAEGWLVAFKFEFSLFHSRLGVVTITWQIRTR